MSCHHPMKAFWTGAYTDKGKKDYLIMPETCGNYCNAGLAKKHGKKITPFAPMIRVNNEILLKDPLSIPCGHCLGCRMDDARQWKVRLVHESMLYPDQSWFVTLTYDDAHLPVDENGQCTLRPDDLTKFMKRLRKYSGQKWRFFACGEYGEHTGRSHMHLILFGSFGDLVPIAFKVFHSKLLFDCWKFGLHEVSPADENCMAYVAGYVEKKQKDPNFGSYPVKPFRRMSRMPALGSWYVDKLEGNPDRKVYGKFGKVHYGPIPPAYLRKCENEPWYEAYKKDSEELAKINKCNEFAVFGTQNEDTIGKMKDEIADEKLEKVRIQKL